MAKEKLSCEEIESRIKQVISTTLGVAENKLQPNLKLRDDLGVDSFTAIELIYNAEDRFGIEITDSEAVNIITIADIIKIVQEKTR